MRIGSLCSGMGGLDLGLLAHLGDSTVAWHAEFDDAPSKVLAHHWPDVPNLHDITATDWHDVEPVDWLTAGYPCQPFSAAGKRKGSKDERHLWPFVADAIRILQPGRVLLENVAGHVSLGLDAVLWDLASLGFDAEWAVVRASAVGAPHRRERVFIFATHPERVGSAGRGAVRDVGDTPADSAGQAYEWQRDRDATDHRGAVAANADSVGGDRGRPCGTRRPEPADRTAADAAGAAWGTSQSELLAAAPGRTAELGERTSAATWGVYAAAISRWEQAIGRSAPLPTEPSRNGNPRLAPRFVEWMMGLPEGWVTDVPGISRNSQLKILGNGVVPQQATLALQLLAELERAA